MNETTRATAHDAHTEGSFRGSTSTNTCVRCMRTATAIPRMKSATEALHELESCRLTRVVCMGMLVLLALAYVAILTMLPRSETKDITRSILLYVACVPLAGITMRGNWKRNAYLWIARVPGDEEDPYVLHCETTPPGAAIHGVLRPLEELPASFVLHVYGVFSRHVDIIAPSQYRHAWSGTLSHGGTFTLQGREAIAFSNLDPKAALTMLMAFPSGHVLRLTSSQLRAVPPMLHGIAGLIEERNDAASLLAKSREERDRLHARSFECDALMERLGAMLSTIALHLEYARAAKPSSRVRMDASLADYNNVGFLISGFQNVMDVLFLDDPPSKPVGALVEQLRESFVKSSEQWRAQAATFITPKPRKSARPTPPA